MKCTMGKEKKVYSSLDRAADSFLSSIKKIQRMMDESNNERSIKIISVAY